MQPYMPPAILAFQRAQQIEREKGQAAQQQQMGQLQQVGALQGILAQVQKQKQMEGALAEDQAMRGAAQGGGGTQAVIERLMATGNPKAIELATKIQASFAKPQGQAIGSGGLRMPDGSVVPPAARPDSGPKPPALRTRVQGETQVQEEFQPDGTWKEVGQGPRFARQVAQAGGGNVQSSGPVKGDFSKTGEDYINTIPISLRNTVKGVANYEIDPKTFAARLGNREKMLEMVKQYAPEYDDTQYGNKRRAIAQFGSGPLGNTARSLNVAIEHTDTLQRAADALKNGQFTPGNKIFNESAKLFGQTPPNTFEGMRNLVANEVLKGTIGTAGALEDRKELADRIKTSSSPEQFKELITGWTELMGGQVVGLERQYTGATGLKDFRDRYLTPRTRDAIALADGKAKGGVPEYATEADAVKAGVKPGQRLKIGGREGTWR